MINEMDYTQDQSETMSQIMNTCSKFDLEESMMEEQPLPQNSTFTFGGKASPRKQDLLGSIDVVLGSSAQSGKSNFGYDVKEISLMSCPDEFYPDFGKMVSPEIVKGVRQMDVIDVESEQDSLVECVLGPDDLNWLGETSELFSLDFEALRKLYLKLEMDRFKLLSVVHIEGTRMFLLEKLLGV